MAKFFKKKPSLWTIILGHLKRNARSPALLRGLVAETLFWMTLYNVARTSSLGSDHRFLLSKLKCFVYTNTDKQIWQRDF